jgi:hypothetical protein
MGRQRMALERGLNPKLSRRMCVALTGFEASQRHWAGVAKRPREPISRIPIARFASIKQITVERRDENDSTGTYLVHEVCGEYDGTAALVFANDIPRHAA